MSIMERELAEGIQDDLNAGIEEVMAEMKAMENRLQVQIEYLEAKLGWVANAADRRATPRPNIVRDSPVVQFTDERTDR